MDRSVCLISGTLTYTAEVYTVVMSVCCHRSLEHSTILYESSGLTPLMRTTWNRQDPNYIATISTESNKVIILDIR